MKGRKTDFDRSENIDMSSEEDEPREVRNKTDVNTLGKFLLSSS